MIKDLRAVKGKFLIERLIAEGEHECQDFKYKISDARKIARTLSAFANHKGGKLLIGVKDNGAIAGVHSEEDIYMIDTAAESFCEPTPSVTYKAYKANDEGAVVIVAEVQPVDESSEFVCVRESGGRLQAYLRVKDENIAAPYILVRARRQRMSLEGVTLRHGGPEDLVVKTIMEIERPTLPRLLKSVKTSSILATRALENLLAIGAITMRYDGTEFVFCTE